MFLRRAVSSFVFGRTTVRWLKQDLTKHSQQFYLLNSANPMSLFANRITDGFGRQTSCNQRHCIHLKLYRQQFSSSSKTPPASDSEHWGPYLVSRIHKLEESSRFHGYSILRWGLSTVTVILAGVYLFRDDLRSNVAEEVADVASRSMADENVILKAHDMTKEVLQRLTKEEDTIALVSDFLNAVLLQDDVRGTAVEFTMSILNHPQTQSKVQEVVKNTLHSVLNDKDTKELLLGFIKNLIEDPKTKQTCNIFLQTLTKDPEVQKIVSEFFRSVLASQAFQDEAVMLGLEVTNKVVHDKEIQEQTGDALWSAMKYGITPYWFRQGK